MTRNKKYRSAGISAALLLMTALCGCSGQPAVTDLTAGLAGRGSEPTPAQTDAPSQAKPTGTDSGSLSTVSQTADAATVTDFALKLFRQDLKQERQEDPKKNVLISPVSVLYALSMTANGAGGQTLAQMESVLGASIPALNAYLYQYRTSLPQGEGCKLSLANSIWFRDDPRFTVNQDFLEAGAQWYGAGLYQAPFDSSTVKAVNKWVSDSTDKMIPTILEEIPQDAVMYLINGLAFDAEWENVYESDDVRKADFTEEDGTKYQAEQMYSSEFFYLQDDNARGFLKYYKGRTYAFAALLPNEGLSVAEYIGTLDGQSLQKLLSHPVNTSVSASIPKFEAEYSIEMSGIFEALGMTDAFDGDLADFSGIGSSTAGPLFISQILHKTYIGVNGKGTRAGAATAVVTSDGCAPMSQQEVYLNRPFVYLIIDCEENVPVFMGAFMSVE